MVRPNGSVIGADNEGRERDPVIRCALSRETLVCDKFMHRRAHRQSASGETTVRRSSKLLRISGWAPPVAVPHSDRGTQIRPVPARQRTWVPWAASVASAYGPSAAAPGAAAP